MTEEREAVAVAVAAAHDSDDDGAPSLSAETLAALKEFLTENKNRHVSTGGEDTTAEDEEVALVREDWRLSQFWYDRDTAETVSEEILSLRESVVREEGGGGDVACIACPTLYAYLKKIQPDLTVQLLEYDKRFEQYGSEFTFYDYNEPETLPSSLKNAYRIIIADPPYLSRECLEKVSRTVSFLMRPGTATYLLLLTGEVQKDRAAELLNVYPCGFRPQHSSKLGNEFRLFTNYDPETRLGGWKVDL